ncbi:anaphase-promoting complex subunit Apc5 [Schizosaccharomyces japonicus yFS275]|uniref:Anaphase-promoting complex subunit 5 n=1 Tax=Schizosaccharomyces japonicus (strain yFS275 / FY16936) TaxID=402676 RepID=B6K7F2_SCHJY|nr:anaphase-promoting complex subunit Apc5 [Schizosaccharomyces japonicus yFS275]EEB09456.1 anaphase-promoting complex subunit Apc5 [Schizosaccharomyces japonicus yFS275]
MHSFSSSSVIETALPVPLRKNVEKPVMKTGFLTPHKFTICVLIELYAYHVLSSEGVQQLFDMILEYYTAEAFHPQTLAYINSVTKELSSSSSECSVYDLLHQRLWNFHGFEDLYEFFMGLRVLLAAPGEQPAEQSQEDHLMFAPSSVLSVFLRKCITEFRSFSFEQEVQFFKSFLSYRAPSVEFSRDGEALCEVNIRHELKNLASNPTLLSLVLNDIPDCHSTMDMDSLDQFLIQHLQRFGANVPSEIEKRYIQMLNPRNLNTSNTCYVKFLTAWRNGDYQQSIEYLFGYFDHVMQHNEYASYQYALLNLAMLQADFGCRDKAYRAIEDAINTARENNDTACLNFALAWLYEFQQQQEMPDHVKQADPERILQYLSKSSQRTGASELQCTSYLMHVDNLLRENTCLTTIFSDFFKATALQNVCKSTQCLATMTVQRATVWERLCNSSYGTLLLETYLAYCTNKANVIDKTAIYIKKAQKKALLGDWEAAHVTLESARGHAQWSFQANRKFEYELLLLKLEKSINEQNFRCAARILKSISGVQYERGAFDRLTLLSIRYDMALGNFSRAMDAIDDLSLSNEWQSCLPRLELKKLKIEIYLQTGMRKRVLVEAIDFIKLAAKHNFRVYFLHGLCLLVLCASMKCRKAEYLLNSIMPDILVSENKELCALAFYTLATLYSLNFERLQPTKAFVLSLYNASYEAYRSCCMIKKQKDVFRAKILFLRSVQDESLDQYVEEYRNMFFSDGLERFENETSEVTATV